jgi:hypothetical protein
MNAEWLKEFEEDLKQEYQTMRAARSEYLAELRSDASDWESCGDDDEDGE